MNLSYILLLGLFGILFLLAEVLVVPGIGILGILGFFAMITSIYFAYSIGITEGNIVLTSNILATAGCLYLTFSNKVWKRISIHSNISGRVNEIPTKTIKIGDIGKSTTRINPIGKANFNNQFYEVISNDGFINENTPIIITKINHSKIFIKKQ